MPLDQATRCPHCLTVFRVASETLAQAQGWLRCGHCRQPFDSTDLAVHWTPEAAAPPERMDLKALLKVEDPGEPGDAPASQTDAAQELLSFEQALATFPRQAPQEQALPGTARSPWPRVLWLVLLLCLTVVQLAWIWRSHWQQTPWVARTLQAACAQLGCALPPAREPELLKIESAHFVRTEEGYRLEWALRSLSVWPLRMSAMELALTDEAGQVLAQRVLMPQDWGAPEQLQPNQTREAVVLVQVPQDLPVSNYRLLAFYP